MTTTVNHPLTAQPSAAPARTPASKQKKKGVLHYIGVGLSFGMLSLVLLLAVLVVALPMLTKSTPYTLVIVKPTDTQQIHLGDVITYQITSNEPAVITHRVIQIVEPAKAGDEVKFITKGDANSLPDPVVKPVQVRGVVWYAVPFIGWINNVINGGTRNVLVPIIAGGLFLYAGFMGASTVIERRRKRAAELATAEQEQLDSELRELVDAPRG